MRSFNDHAGRSWSIEVSMALLRRVRNQCDGLQLLNVQGLLTGLADDPIRLVELLFVIVESQAIERGITPEQFGAAMDGESLENAFWSLCEATADFHPPNRRKMLLDYLRVARDANERAAVRAAEVLADPHLIDKLEASLLDTFDQLSRK